MNFTQIAMTRQSCRSYDPSKDVEDEKLRAILESAILSPSACNGQPYHITVCKGNKAREVSDHVTGLGMNKFAKDAPVMIVISEDDYIATAAFGSKVKKMITAQLILASCQLISPLKQQLRGLEHAFWAGLMMKK